MNSRLFLILSNSSLITFFNFLNCLFFINRIESNLCETKFLVSNKISIADVAIFPFIRQFANVNLDQFIKGEFKKTISWFEVMNKQDLFSKAMEKPSIKSK